MNRSNAEDPLEKLLREQPLDRAPSAVYERLQAKAAWNRTPTSRWPILLGGLIVMAAVVGALWFSTLHEPARGEAPRSEAPDLSAPLVVPASAPIVARALPEAASPSDDDIVEQVGGFSSRWVINEPAFAVTFDMESELGSNRLSELGS